MKIKWLSTCVCISNKQRNLNKFGDLNYNDNLPYVMLSNPNTVMYNSDKPSPAFLK